jgi:hypothetical protein
MTHISSDLIYIKITKNISQRLRKIVELWIDPSDKSFGADRQKLDS